MKLIVQKNWNNFSTLFYLEYERNGKRVIIGQKEGSLFEQTIDETTVSAEPIRPLLNLPDRMAEDFIKGIVDYASDQGVKTINENLMQGKLIATEKHLEDMRVNFTKVLDKLVDASQDTLICHETRK